MAVKMIVEEIENLDISITSKEIELVIKKMTHKEKLRPRWLHW